MLFSELDDFDKILVVFAQDPEFYKELIFSGKIDDALAIVDLMAHDAIVQGVEVDR